MRIADVCTRYAIDVAADAPVREAARQMRSSHVGALVVVESVAGGRKPVGILTDRDIVIGVVAPDIDPDAIEVGDVMTRELATCRDDEDVFDAISRMRHLGIRRLPVVDAGGLLVGMLTADDVLGAVAAELGDLSRAFSREQVREIATRV
jgi:CBS domain-containing protein